MKNIKEQLSNTVQEVLDGNFDSLEAFAELNLLEKFVKECKNKVEESALAEANKYDKTFVHQGYQFTSKNGSARYNWDSVKPVIFATEELKALKLKYVNRLNNTDGFSEDTGEVFENLPKKTYSKDSLSIKKL